MAELISKKKLCLIFLAIIILAYFLFQIPRINFNYVISDEALYARESWYISKNPLEVFNPEFLKYYVPLTPALFAPFNFFLEPVQAFRFGVLLSSIIGIILIFLLGKKLYSEEIGLISAGLLAFSPTFLYFSTTAFLDIPLTVAGIAAMMLAANPLVKNWKIIAAAIVIFSIKVTGAVLFPAIIITRLIAKNKKISKKQALGTIALTAIGIIAVICVSMILGISGIAIVIAGLKPGLNILLSLLLLGQQLIAYTLGYAILPFFLIGIIVLMRNKNKEEKRKNLIISVWALSILGVFTAFTIIQSRYFLPAVPALVLISAFGIKEIIPKQAKEKKSGLITVFAITLIVCFFSTTASIWLKSENQPEPQGYNELRAFFSQNFSKEDEIVLFGNQFRNRGTRLYSELGMQENWKKISENPTKDAFEKTLENTKGTVFVIYSDYGKEAENNWIFKETNIEEYFKQIGLEKQKEINQEQIFGIQTKAAIYTTKKK